RGAHHRNRVPGRHLEAEPLENLPLGLVSKGDVLEPDLPAPDLQLPGTGLVFYFRISSQNPEHQLDVDHRLLDLTIDHTHEIERLVELDHHCIEHHQIADRIGALADAEDAHHHERREPDGEDRRLPGIADSKRHVGL